MADASNLRERLFVGASWDALGLDLAISVDHALDEVADWLRNEATMVRALCPRDTSTALKAEMSEAIIETHARGLEMLADSLVEETGA